MFNTPLFSEMFKMYLLCICLLVCVCVCNIPFLCAVEGNYESDTFN